MNDWIRVKDDMPKDGQKVFVYALDVEHEGPDMLSVIYHIAPKEPTTWWNLPNGGYIWDVTHWMSRPDPPEVNNGLGIL